MHALTPVHVGEIIFGGREVFSLRFNLILYINLPLSFIIMPSIRPYTFAQRLLLSRQHCLAFCIQMEKKTRTVKNLRLNLKTLNFMLSRKEQSDSGNESRVELKKGEGR